MKKRMTADTSRACDVVGLGSIVVDEQMFLNQIPGEDEKEQATELRLQIGGPVPTALTMLRRFQKQCHFIGPWGDDSRGVAIETDLISEGMTFSDNCRVSKRRSGLAHVWTSSATGTRTIAAMPCDWNGFALSPEDITRLHHCRLLHLDGSGSDIAIQAALEVQTSGGRIFVDAGSPKEATAKLIPMASVFSFPERFAAQFFGTSDIVTAGKEILRLGAAAAICTRGENGAVVFEEDDVTRVPAFPTDVVDSTGAGDVFCGGVIAGLLNGQPVKKAVLTGSAAAALKCRKAGNRAALPTPEMIRQLL